MMCYRDMTFCTGDGCKKFDNCPRALTDQVRADAVKWWKSDDAPIAFFESPKELPCYEPETNEQ